MTFKLNGGQKRAMLELLTTISRFCLMYGGSRSGKTFLAVACIIDRALIAPNSRHLIIRKTSGSAVRSVVHDTFPKAWKAKYPDVPCPEYNAQLGRYVFDNGSEVWIGGVNTEDAVERLLGAEYATIYVNETRTSHWPSQRSTITCRSIRTRTLPTSPKSTSTTSTP